MSHIGKQFQVVANKEDYTVLEEHDQGYLTVQPSAYKRAGLESGCDVIHVSEIDGVEYEWHAPVISHTLKSKIL